MIKGTLILLFILYSSIVLAATHCICEMGDNNKLACDFWLAKKTCSTKRVFDNTLGRPLSSYLTVASEGDTIELGYIGPWLGMLQTMEFLEEQIVPVVTKKHLRLNYDNTAPLSLEDPDVVQEFLSNLVIPSESSIFVKGLQTRTVGLWENLFWGRTEFFAEASTEWNVVRYPNCTEVSNKYCSSNQLGDQGRCHDVRKMWHTCRRSNSLFGGYTWQKNN